MHKILGLIPTPRTTTTTKGFFFREGTCNTSSIQTLSERWVELGHPAVQAAPCNFVLISTNLLTPQKEGQGPGWRLGWLLSQSKPPSGGQGAVPGVGEGIQLQRQGLRVTTMSSQMANSARVLSFIRCHFLWGQGRDDGNPTKGWFDKLPLLRAREIWRDGRAGSGFCQTPSTEGKPQTACRPWCCPPLLSFPTKLEWSEQSI